MPPPKALLSRDSEDEEGKTKRPPSVKEGTKKKKRKVEEELEEDKKEVFLESSVEGKNKVHVGACSSATTRPEPKEGKKKWWVCKAEEPTANEDGKDSKIQVPVEAVESEDDYDNPWEIDAPEAMMAYNQEMRAVYAHQERRAEERRAVWYAQVPDDPRDDFRFGQDELWSRRI